MHPCSIVMYFLKQKLLNKSTHMALFGFFGQTNTFVTKLYLGYMQYIL